MAVLKFAIAVCSPVAFFDIVASCQQSQPSSPTSKRSNTTSPKKRAHMKSGAARESDPSTSVRRGRTCSAPGQSGRPRGCDVYNCDTFGVNVEGSEGRSAQRSGTGWDFEAMLAENERLTGRTFVYDGNPSDFGNAAQAPHSTPTPRDVCRKQEPEASQADFCHLEANNAGGVQDVGLGQKQGRKRGGRSKSAGKAVRGDISAMRRAKAAEGSSARDDSASSLSLWAVLKDVGHQDARAQSSTALCTEAAAALCTQDGDAKPSCTGRSSGGLFGEFTFDMVDIMSAVPRG